MNKYADIGCRLVLFTWLAAASTVAFAAGYGNPRVAEIVKIIDFGARAHLNPNGKNFVFDRPNADGYYDLYLADLNGNILLSLTSGKNITQKNNGNGIFHPSGTFVGFISQVDPHYLSGLPATNQQMPLGDPGTGLFGNLWTTDGRTFRQQTTIPIKQTKDDPTPVYATVNPRFTPDWKSVIWTERYANGGRNNWGLWRLVKADLTGSKTDGIGLTNQRVIFTPAAGNYVTAMTFNGLDSVLAAGNLDGQHEYGMDLYSLNLKTGAYKNLTNTPNAWEEGACIAPSGKIVYMSNENSRYTLNFDKDWVGQPLERDYYLMNADGSGKERLTYFNDPGYLDYQGWRAVTIICEVTSDGKTIIASIGRDYGTEAQAFLVWQIWLIKLKEAL